MYAYFNIFKKESYLNNRLCDKLKTLVATILYDNNMQTRKTTVYYSIKNIYSFEICNGVFKIHLKDIIVLYFI